MGLRAELARLLGEGRPPVPPMPCDCEDPARGAGLTPGLEELLGRGSGGLLDDPRGAGSSPDAWRGGGARPPRWPGA